MRKIGKLSDRLLKAKIVLPERRSSSYAVCDYNLYTLNLKDGVLFLIKTGGILFLVSMAFYDSCVPFVLGLLPVLFICSKKEVGKKIKRRKEKLKKEFLTEINLMGDYLRSGYSVENAIVASEKEMSELYGEDSDMVREIQLMKQGFALNLSPEEVILNFSERSGVKEIQEFASVFSLVNRSGGQVREIILEISGNLTMAFETEDEINTALTSKKLEQKIMDLMPIGILYYVKTASYDLLSCMYQTLTGRMIMTLCLAVYLFSYLWSEKILDIKVSE